MMTEITTPLEGAPTALARNANWQEQSPQAMSHVALERVDLQSVIADKTLSLHRRLMLRVNQPEFCASIRVIDLAQVFITPEAKTALVRSYIAPAYLLEKFGLHYAAKVFSTVTRGSHKGDTYINRTANVYIHPSDGGPDLVVTGTCVERDGKPIREVHITCGKQVVTPSDFPGSGNGAGSVNIAEAEASAAI